MFEKSSHWFSNDGLFFFFFFPHLENGPNGGLRFTLRFLREDWGFETCICSIVLS